MSEYGSHYIPVDELENLPWACDICSAEFPNRKGKNSPHNVEGGAQTRSDVVKICGKCIHHHRHLHVPAPGKPTPEKQQLDIHPRLFNPDTLEADR